MIQKAASHYLGWKYKQMLKAQKAPIRAQERAFQRLRESLQDSESSAPELRKAQSLEDFARLAQARSYVDYQSEIESQIYGRSRSLFNDDLIYVGLSSATTSPKSKAIPYNRQMLKAWENFQLHVSSVLEASSPVRIAGHQRLTWGSTPIVERFPGDIPGGYVSGFLSMRSPKLIQKRCFPQKESMLVSDMALKTERMKEELKGADLRLISGVPSYLVNLLEELRQAWGVADLSEAFPNLTTCIYSSTPIHAWRDQIDSLVGRPLKYLGCYASTEAALGYEIPELNSNTNGLYSFHLEDFVFLFRNWGEDGRIMSMAELKPGDEVELLVSSPNGLINYAMGDLLKIHSVSPTILFEVLGRIGQGMNVAAEKVSCDEIQRVVQMAAQRLGANPRHFFVHPGKSNLARPNYSWTICLDQCNDPSGASWAQALDEALMNMNEDYKEAREDLHFIDRPSVRVVEASGIQKYFKQQFSRGQLKLKSVFESQEKFEAYFSQISSELA